MLLSGQEAELSGPLEQPGWRRLLNLCVVVRDKFLANSMRLVKAQGRTFNRDSCKIEKSMAVGTEWLEMVAL
jgi:hypothetical protein